MAKTLPSGEIQVEQGDTLSGIYGSNWKELSGYTGDPTKLPIGQVLPAKSSGSLGGSLAGGGEEKALPDQPIDGLSRFGDMLKMITQRSAKESMAKGGEALPEGMLDPEQVSGGTFANVLNLVTQQKTRGIADIYKSTVDMITDTRTRANDQLKMLVDTGGITKLDDVTLQKLSDMTDYDFEYLKGIKTAKQEQATDEIEMNDVSRVDNINNFLLDKVGGDKKISAESYIQAYQRWRSLKGAMNDFKYAYPVEKWVGEHEWNNLPQDWIPESEDEKKITIESARKSMYAQLDKVVGSDGFVSPDDYAKAKAAWVRETGFLAEKFDEAMSIYRDPDNNNYKIEY